MGGSAPEKLRFALELYDLGERMLRQRLGREHPQASDAVIDDRVDISAAGRRLALVGGLAVSARAEPRAEYAAGSRVLP